MNSKEFIKELASAGTSSALVNLNKQYVSAKDSEEVTVGKDIIKVNNLAIKLVGGENALRIQTYAHNGEEIDEEVVIENFINACDDDPDLVEYSEYFNHLIRKTSQSEEWGEVFDAMYYYDVPMLCYTNDTDSWIDGYLVSMDNMSIIRVLKDSEVEEVTSILKKYKELC